MEKMKKMTMMKKAEKTQKIHLAALAASLAVAAICMPAAHAKKASVPAQPHAAAILGQQPVDMIAAVVNDGVITERELDARIALVARRLQQQKAPVPPLGQLRAQVLTQIVLERIQLQKAREDNITVDDSTVLHTLERLAQANNLSLDAYRARIEAAGVPWGTFVSDARTELILSRVREKEVDSKITVSDAEVANYIASQHGLSAGQFNDLRIEHILLKVTQDAPQAEVDAAQQKAQALLKEALDGKNFERLARSNSQAADAKKGGDMGFLPSAQLPPDLVQATSTLHPGEVSPTLMRTDNGFEIVRLVERRQGQDNNSSGIVPIVLTHTRHILLHVGDGMNDAQARQKLMELRQQIAAGADFGQLARTWSQDGSSSQGGDLGWISPGQTVPEFERAMNGLQDGQVSMPVRSEYGYHLIQVLGRREVQGSLSQQMDLAREAIGQRKAEKQYADWLRELHDSAYIDYKTNLPQ
jgi:peptidyl-prolyl cis-trans isomerase SurA